MAEQKGIRNASEAYRVSLLATDRRSRVSLNQLFAITDYRVSTLHRRRH